MRLLRLLSIPLFALAPLPAQTVEELVATLAKAETLDDEAIGDAGIKSDTYRTYEQLRERATLDHLLQLIAHDAPIVRGYALRALADRKEAVDWPKLLQARSQDVAKVSSSEGCMRAERMVGDVAVELARHRTLLTDEQWLDLGQHLVTTRSPLYAREWALRNLRFRDGMLHRLRALAVAGDGPAHIALARYGIAKDLPRLVAWLQRDGAFDDTTALAAARVFPDPSLLPVLVGLERKARGMIAAGLVYRLREWLAAFAAQRDATAVGFLQRFLAETPKDTHHRDVLRIYEELLAPLATDDRFDGVREELTRQTRR